MSDPVTLGALAGLLTLFLPFALALPASAACCRCVGADPSKSTCLTTSKGTCASINADYSSNASLANITCDPADIGDSCKPKDQTGGVCDEIADAQTYGAAAASTASTETAEPQVPVLNVNIPGLTFPTKVEAGGGVVSSPFIGLYIAGVYKYLVGVSVIAAAIMIVYGGFLYILGSSVTAISTGKQRVTDAIIGLLLVLGSYTILNVLNPALTGPEKLGVQQLEEQKSFSNPAQERARVEQAATVTPAPTEEVPVVPSDAPPELAQPTPPPVTPGAPAPAAPAPTPPVGAIARNPQGGLIAQRGRCPEAMIAIPSSQEYTPTDSITGKKAFQQVNSFCIDIYEAPNDPKQKPYRVTDWEADWFCRDHGKRLCTTSEWVRACLGPKGENTYGYGPTFIPGLNVTAGRDGSDPKWYDTKKGGDKPGPCNYDTLPKGSPNWGKLAGYASKTPEESILNRDNPKLADPKVKAKYDKAVAELARLDGSELSGSRPQCFTEEGVFDMSGNVAEYTVKEKFAKLTTDQRVAIGPVAGSAKPYQWMGFYWAPIAHQATTKATPKCTFSAGGPHNTGSGWRDYANGFRCCTDLNLGQ